MVNMKKLFFFFKYSLLLRSRLLSNTVLSQLKTTAWLLPERQWIQQMDSKGIKCLSGAQSPITLRCLGPAGPWEM